MNRINYLTPAAERILGGAFAALAEPLRDALLVFAGALVAVGASWGVQQARLAAAAHDAAVLSAAFARIERSMARVHAIQTERDRAVALAARIDVMRTTGGRRAAALAALGNELPRQASLSSITTETDGYTVEGRADRVATVGAAMTGLARAETFSQARIVSVRADDGEGDVSYTIAVGAR